eukprot:EG_transcript_13684
MAVSFITFPAGVPVAPNPEPAAAPSKRRKQKTRSKSKRNTALMAIQRHYRQTLAQHADADEDTDEELESPEVDSKEGMRRMEALLAALHALEVVERDARWECYGFESGSWENLTQELLDMIDDLDLPWGRFAAESFDEMLEDEEEPTEEAPHAEMEVEREEACPPAPEAPKPAEPAKLCAAAPGMVHNPYSLAGPCPAHPALYYKDPETGLVCAPHLALRPCRAPAPRKPWVVRLISRMNLDQDL